MNKKKVKRPRGEEPKDCNLHIRCTKSQVDLLDMLSCKHEKSKTDLIWEALKSYRVEDKQ